MIHGTKLILVAAKAKVAPIQHPITIPRLTIHNKINDNSQESRINHETTMLGFKTKILTISFLKKRFLK